MGLSPAADAAPDLIKLAGGVFIAAMRHDSRMIGEPEEEPQFLDIDLRAAQKRAAILCVCCFDDGEHQVGGGSLQPISQQELVIARKFFNDDQ